MGASGRPKEGVYGSQGTPQIARQLRILPFAFPNVAWGASTGKFYQISVGVDPAPVQFRGWGGGVIGHLAQKCLSNRET